MTQSNTPDDPNTKANDSDTERVIRSNAELSTALREAADALRECVDMLGRITRNGGPMDRVADNLAEALRDSGYTLQREPARREPPPDGPRPMNVR